MDESKWLIELCTDDVLCHDIELTAVEVIKLTHYDVLIDGEIWSLNSDIKGMSFGRVEKR